jgi:hypothetical protein
MDDSDSAAALPPLGSLGWRGRWQYDDKEVRILHKLYGFRLAAIDAVDVRQVVQLRETLEEEAGIPGLEHDMVDPALPGFAKLAAEIFHRDGFCIVKDALTPEALATIRDGCDSTIRKILQHDPERRGNRDSHRYSFAGSPQKFGCAQNWCAPSVLSSLGGVRSNTRFRRVV